MVCGSTLYMQERRRVHREVTREMMAAKLDSAFVVDGCERAERAIRAEVESEFAERWRHATFWDRIRLWREIEREIARRCDNEAPGHALY